MYPIATFSANGTSTPYTILQGAGGPQILFAGGTFGGGSLAFQVSADGTNWATLEVGSTAIAWTATSSVALFYIAPGMQIRAVLTGATSPAITVSLGWGV